MFRCKIDEINEVADTSAIRRVIVVAPDHELLAVSDRPRVVLDNLPKHCHMIEIGTTAGTSKPGKRSRNWHDVCYAIERKIHRSKVIAIVDCASQSAARPRPLRHALSSYRFRAGHPTLLSVDSRFPEMCDCGSCTNGVTWPRFVSVATELIGRDRTSELVTPLLPPRASAV